MTEIANEHVYVYNNYVVHYEQGLGRMFVYSSAFNRTYLSCLIIVYWLLNEIVINFHRTVHI